MEGWTKRFLRSLGRDPRRAAVVLFLLPVIHGCGGDSASSGGGGATAVTVAAWTVSSEPIAVERRWVGRLEPLRVLSVQAPREGRVEELTVRDGELVQAGQILARLIGPDIAARLSSAQAQSRQLDDELERWQGLATSGAAGAGEVAEATLRALQAREQLAELSALTDSYLIRAPSAGRVYGTAVGSGTQVGAGQLLMQVEDRSTWGVRLSVPSWETPYFERAENLLIIGEGGARLEVDRIAFASDIHPGFVRIDVYLTGNPSLRTGVEVEYRSSESALILPWTAVAGQGDNHWVALIVPGEPARVERRRVELGGSHPSGVEVVAGIEPGDQVIRYEPRSHPEGRAVNPVEGGR